MVSNRVAIIPARGGSKRIPYKNIIPFNGKPMLAWTIESALESGLFDKVIVSTDDKKIADIALQYGAEVPFLREQYCDDYSHVSDVVIYTLEQIGMHFGITYDVVVQLMPNCPIRNSQDIINLIQFAESFDLVTPVLSAFKFGWMNPHWAHTLDSTYKATRLFKETLNKRSQDLPELYCPSGAIWYSKVADLMQSGSFWHNYRFFELDYKQAVDIDTTDDLALADLFYQMIKKSPEIVG